MSSFEVLLPLLVYCLSTTIASDTSNLSEEEHDCLQAVRGQQVPKALDDEITQFCVIRGIRYHPGFATELHGQLPKFTRALNARAIMSDRIPEMDDKDPDQFPYCIWYPETAKEATYRALAARYPQMKYLVGRRVRSLVMSIYTRS